ncbi:MAG TPA: GNAT family N-acetyltransferase [Candidatus Binataceae bacterium]|nr:GNAT family N-acetyltransferase [Candidatus Binataceae bacterium]
MESRPELDPRNYAVDEILRDGSSMHIRAIRPDDKTRLFEHFSALSPQSRYQRFFGAKRRLTADELVALTELDFDSHVGLVATLYDGAVEKIIGVGRYIRVADKARAEVAFAVLDAFQGRGIGTLLLEHLSRIAREAGITEFEADVLGDNRRMLQVFGESGMQVKRSMEGGAVHVALVTTPTAQGAELAAEREQKAAAQSISRILNPRSVAVVGASRDPGKIGGSILANLIRDGFHGPIYPINPGGGEIQGLRAYKSLAEVGSPIDLAVITVPAEAVEAAIDDCARGGVLGTVVITSGFAETSSGGAITQHRLLEKVRSAGMRMIGPNCMGILNTNPVVSLNATFAPNPAPRGNIAMFSESGALGLAVLDYARARNLGVSSFISAGNRADVSSNDLLAYWADDPDTAVIVLYLESFGNPLKFAHLAPIVAQSKPIIAVKAGRTAAGTRAASSHSAALASSDVGIDALFEQAGVVRASTLEEMFDIVTLISQQPAPKGNRVGIVTNAGGPGILLSDGCEARGLSVPQLDPATISELRSFLSDRAGFANPIDMTAAAPVEHYVRTIATVGADPNVDAVISIYIPPFRAQDTSVIATAIAQGAAKVPADKPVLCVFLSSQGAPATLHQGPRGPIPTYSFPENAAIALAAARRRAVWLDRPRGTATTLSDFARGAIRAVIDRVLAGATDPVWLSAEDTAVVLESAGIMMAFAEHAKPDDAVKVAEQLEYPLVAKAIAPGVIHKTEVGGVIVGLESAADVQTAVATLQERMKKAGTHLDAVLLQREVREGIEAIIGVTADPTFGPLIAVGSGGVLAEIMRDVAFRLHPVTDVDAGEMLAAVRLNRLLDGYRGSKPGDRDALRAMITNVSALTEVIPELVDLDLNPVKVLPPGEGAVVLDARIRIAPIRPAAHVRRH